MKKSSGNVFADLGLPNPELHLIKANLAHHICKYIKDLSLGQAAQKLGTNIQYTSSILRGDFDELSVDKLLNIIFNLDPEIKINIEIKEKIKEKN